MKSFFSLRDAPNYLFGWAAIAWLTGICNAQLAQSVQSPVNGVSRAAESDYAVAKVGPHSRVWQNSSGQSVTEIATGMNYLNAQGQWTPSVNAFAVSQDGNSFIADQIQDPTQLAANINQQAAVTAVTPEGVTMRSTPTAIVLYDAATGLSAIVGTITNSIGVLVDNQHIVYTNAFSSSLFSASVVYSLPDTGSFHQDVIFTGFDTNFDPTAYGFAAGAANTLQIEVMTEFINPPQPMAQERDLYIEQDPNLRASMASPDQIDYTLDFGHYVFGPGRAYTTSSSPGAGAGVVVTKDFVTTNGRSFLIESTSLKSIAGYLNTLPAPKPTASLNPPPSARKRMVAWEGIPALKKNAIQAKAMKIAGLMPSGFDVDYIATVSSTVEPKLYSSDTTYFVSGNVYESSAVTMESAVFKYPTSAGRIEIASTLTLATTNYRTAIFTSADDPTAGATLSTNIWSGYTGTPSGNRYGSQALLLNSSASAITLNNLRFCYMNLALQINADMAAQTLTMWHSQFVDCYEGVYVDGGNGSNTNDSLTFNLYNCLFTDVGTSFEIGGIVFAGNAYNCTDDSSTDLVTVDSGTTVTGNFRFTNSIFSTLASKGTLGSSLSLGGGSNVFYNCGSATFGSFNTLASNPYITSGAGSYYIANNSSYLTNGTTNIPVALLSQLGMKTTQPPLILSTKIESDTVLMPIAQRDTNGMALGFLYDPIDYICACSVSNATLFLVGGVSLAYYDNLGINLLDGSQLVAQGTPNQRDYLVYYNLVQEQPLNLWGVSNAIAQSVPIAPAPIGSSANPSIFLRLTTINAPTGETNLFNTADFGKTGQVISGLTLRDCEVYGAGANWIMTESNNTPSVGLTNNVFYRVPFAVTNNATITSINNLFYGTTNVITNVTVGGITNVVTNTLVAIRHLSGTSHNTNQNDVFNGVTASLDGTVGYNAYVNGGTNSTFQGSDIRTNVTWLAGPLGTYYQSSNSPLINAGSTSANNLDLYHYTVTTNLVSGAEIKETNSAVDLGYHYVAVTSAGIPISTNGSGVPDYLAGFTSTGIANAWLMAYFGTLDVNSNLSYDGTGLTVLQDYQSSLDPNVISFNLWVTNQYVNTATVPLQANIISGMPSYVAVLVDNTNWSSASWIPYTSPFHVSLGGSQGWHQVWVGLRGLPATGQQSWAWCELNLDTTPPVLVITNPVPGVVTSPIIQVQGYSLEDLAVFTYDLTNSSGLWTNQLGLVTSSQFDTNAWAATTNAIACVNVSLAVGTNIITLHATDIGGNIRTTNLTYVYNPAANTNAPVISLAWPQNGTVVASTTFTARGLVNDPFASVNATIVNGGTTTQVPGVVEANGSFWIESLPLGTGTNYLTITATNSAGYGISTNIAVTKSATVLSEIAVFFDDLVGPVASVGGEGAGSGIVLVNGVAAENEGGGNWLVQDLLVPGWDTAVISLDVTTDGTSRPGDPRTEVEVVAGPAFFYAGYNANVLYSWSEGGYNGYTNLWTFGMPGSDTQSDCGDWYEVNLSTWAGTGIGVNKLGSNSVCGGSPNWGSPTPINLADSYLNTAEHSDLQGSYNDETERRRIQSSWWISSGGQADFTSSLWILNVSAETSCFDVPMNFVGQVVPPNVFSVAGQRVDANGNAYIVTPKGTITDATPKGGPSGYTYSILQTNYTPILKANGVTLSSTATNATFCVGQQITFTVTFSPPLPTSMSNIVYNWTLAPTFVNSWTSNSSTGCLTYSTNLSLLRGTSNSTSCWYVNGASGTANVGISIRLPNGNYVSMATLGKFAIYRPKITSISSLSSPYVTNFSGYLSLGNGNLGDMSFDVNINSTVAGSADITQLINRNGNSGGSLDTTSGQYWLDQVRFYKSGGNNPNLVLPCPIGNSYIPFSDGPEIALNFSSPFYYTTSTSDQFIDYVVFRPGGQLASTNIYVTLGKASWSWSGYTIYTNSSWSVPTGSASPPSSFDNSTDIPQWPQVHSNN